MSEFWSLVVASVPGLVAAVVASHLSARWAVLRLRSEKAFERRMEWYENATRQLLESADRMGSALATLEYDELEDAREAEFDRAMSTIKPLNDILTLGELYSPEATRKQIREFKTATLRLAKQGASAENDDLAGARAPVQGMRTLTYHLANQLAREFRDHVGLVEESRFHRWWRWWTVEHPSCSTLEGYPAADACRSPLPVGEHAE